MNDFRFFLAPQKNLSASHPAPTSKSAGDGKRSGRDTGWTADLNSPKRYSTSKNIMLSNNVGSEKGFKSRHCLGTGWASACWW